MDLFLNFQIQELLGEGRGETIFEVGVPLSGDPSCEDYSIGLKQGQGSNFIRELGHDTPLAGTCLMSRLVVRVVTCGTLVIS